MAIKYFLVFILVIAGCVMTFFGNTFRFLFVDLWLYWYKFVSEGQKEFWREVRKHINY